MKNLFKKTLLVTSITALSCVASAANNPVLPTPGSSGGAGVADLLISATVSALFRVSALTDITFAPYTGSGNWTATDTDDFCVYTNNAAGAYTVTLTGTSGAGAGFNLHNGTDTIPYTVNYNGSAYPVGSQTGHQTLPDCGGVASNNSTVEIVIAAADAQSAPASVTAYTGTLTFLIAP